ncbi:MAG: CvpA family protein [Clostridia bacterium]|nr:CvpA family protein [Clostridia bacterium]
MAIAIDLIIIAIIAVFAWISAKRGFVRTVIELVGYVLAVVLAFSVSSAAANAIYEGGMRPKIVNAIQTNIENAKSDDYAGAVEDTWEAIPDFITGMIENTGHTQQSVTEKIESLVTDGAAYAAETVTDTVIKPVAVNLITMLLAAILFIILMIVVKFLAKFINSLFNIPILGTLNTTLGGVVGVVKGGVIVFAVISIIGVSLTIFDNAIWIFTPQLVEETFIFKAIYNLNPLIK